MVHHFLQPLPGELFYSALARTMALVAPYTRADVGKLLFGNRKRSPGLRVPCNGEALLGNVPKVADFTESRLLAASLFPYMAPFLEDVMRDRIRQCIMANDARSKSAAAFQRGSSTDALRYCPVCAREDVASDRPHHWRTLHQHPGVSCCPVHGCLLVIAEGTGGRCGQLSNAVDFVRPAILAPPATDGEIELARTVQRASKSTFTPGPEKLGRALTSALIDTGRFRRGTELMRKLDVIVEVRSKWSDDVLRRVGSPLSGRAPGSWTSAILNGNGVGLGHRYAIIASILNLSLDELIERADRENSRSRLSKPHALSVEMRAAKSRILQVVAAGGGVTRRDFSKRDPVVFKFVARFDRAWYQKHVPRKASKVSETDWSTVDREESLKILTARDTLIDTSSGRRPQKITRNGLLRIAGCRMGRQIWFRTRLPLKEAALERCKESDAKLALRRSKWAIAQCLHSGRALNYDGFLRFAGLPDLATKCPRSRRIAKAAWSRYKRAMAARPH